VGLGNPGRQYEGTRHNAGFIVIDKFAQKLGVKIKRGKFRALLAEAEFEGEKIILAKPQTFMNLSGESVIQIMQFYKLEPERVIVVYDDVYIKFGEVRTRMNGSDGGQNGMKNIISHLRTEKFPRVRIGTGPMPEDEPLIDYVLGGFSKKELNELTSDIYTNFLEGIRLIARETSRATK